MEQMEFLPTTIDGKNVYIGFRKRFNAVVLDFIILTPISFLFIWLEGINISFAIFGAILSSILFQMYFICFNAIYGGTLGKLKIGIRITKPNGAPIGWFEAWKRSSVYLVFTIITLIAQIIALTHVNQGEYFSAPWRARYELLDKFMPIWVGGVVIASQIWVCGELIVLLLNKRKRAIHDFIAGTIVVDNEFAKHPRIPDA
jgi:uncharacterized RDD family membrane protein YckC